MPATPDRSPDCLPRCSFRRSVRSTRRGFSLLELVVVIGIIVLLASILFVGINAIRRSQEQRNTTAALEVARSMFNAYVSSARSGGNNLSSGVTGGTAGGAGTFYLRLTPSQWNFNGPTYGSPLAQTKIADLRKSGSSTLIDYANSIDYYNVPLRESQSRTAIPVPMDIPLAKAGERDTWDDVPANWQLEATMQTIRRLRSSPEAKALWSQLRETQIAHVGAADSRVDFIIDSWGNPLLFVPGSGVRGVQFGEGAPADRPSPAQYVSGDPNGSTTPLERQGLRSPDGRAFWMSAGPDGYYDTHDDNQYSFSN